MYAQSTSTQRCTGVILILHELPSFQAKQQHFNIQLISDLLYKLHSPSLRVRLTVKETYFSCLYHQYNALGYYSKFVITNHISLASTVIPNSLLALGPHLEPFNHYNPIQGLQEGRILQPVSTYWKHAANESRRPLALNYHKRHSTLEYAHMALDADVYVCLFTCTHNMLLHVCTCCSVCYSLMHMLLITGMLTSTLPLLVSELSLDTRFLMGSQMQICLLSCTVTLSSLVTFIQCDTETSVTSTTAALIPLGNE